MKRTALLPLLALLVVGTSVADDAPKPPKEGRVDPQAAALLLSGMEDSLYAEMRASLAKQPLEDALRVLDEVRRVGRDPLSSRGFDLEFAPRANDPKDRREAPALERALGEAEPWTVRVDPYVVHVTGKYSNKELAAALMHLPDDGGIVTFTHAAATRLLSTWEPDPGLRVARLPTVDLFDGQAGFTHHGAMITYVQDYDEKPGSPGAEPVIGRIQEGVALSCIPRRTADPSRVQVEASLRCCSLRRPVETSKTKLPKSGRDVTIQLPELRRWDTRATTTVALGDWLIVGNNKPLDNGSAVFVLLWVGKVE